MGAHPAPLVIARAQADRQVPETELRGPKRPKRDPQLPLATTGLAKHDSYPTLCAQGVGTRVESEDAMTDKGATLPPQSYWFHILSYVEAERQNASVQFLREFAVLAEAAGHTVTLVKTKDRAAEPPEATVQVTQEKMLAAHAAMPTVTTADAMELEARIFRNEASEDDKWLHFVETYKAAWGLDKIDADFIKKHGTAALPSQVKLLARLLCPELRRDPTADVGIVERNAILKIPLVEETLAALGFESPFDTATVVPDLMAAFEIKLKKTHMFESYNQTSKLFYSTAGVDATWDANKVSKALNMVLGVAGLSLEGETTRARKGGGVREATTRNYRLSADSVGEMLELVKLWLARVGATPSSPHALAALEACTLPKYGHLVTGVATAVEGPGDDPLDPGPGPSPTVA